MKASIFIRYFCGSVAVLLLWQLGSVTLGSDILPDPLRALGGFWDALKDPEFIGHIGLSLYLVNFVPSAVAFAGNAVKSIARETSENLR